VSYLLDSNVVSELRKRARADSGFAHGSQASTMPSCS